MSGQPTPREASAVEPVTPTEAAPAQVVVRKTPKALSQRDPVQIAEHFYRSGFFKDVQSMSQAVVKIIAGEEIGIGPMAAIKGITVIEGDLGYTGNLLATLVKQHPGYEYKVAEKTNERCKIEFYVGDELEGVSEFSVEDAERAELVKPRSNWVKWPRAMCFNRALTEGVRAYIPDVTAGTPAYTDEEIEEVISTEPPAQEAEEAPTAALDDETVEHLHKGFKAVKGDLAAGAVNSLDGLNVLLGSLGIDAFDPNTSLTEQFAKLEPEQAEALGAEFQKLADAAEQSEEVDSDAE